MNNSTGADIDIAIADTLYTLPQDYETSVEIVDSKDFSSQNDEQQEKWGHGFRIFSVLERIVPAARFHFYRLKTTRRQTQGRQRSSRLEDRGNKRIREVLGQSIDDEIDMINMSLGRLHRFCNNCAFDKPVRSVTREGVSIVAAIGNDRNQSHEHTLCPALAQETISVGGVTNQCARQIGRGETDQRIWADTRTIADTSRDYQGPYCSFQGCSTAHQCCERNEVPFDRNIRPLRNGPDILAPAQVPHQPLENGSGEKMATLAEGTSFAAPFATGVAAQIQNTVSPPPTPDLIRDATLHGSTDVVSEEDMYRRLDSLGAREWIRDQRRLDQA